MLFANLLLFSSLICNSSPKLIASIQNTILVPLRFDQSMVQYNDTCEQCLCQLKSPHSLMNCFPNKTCQIFHASPCCYQLEIFSGAHLLFLNQSKLDRKRCCIPNITEVTSQLETARVESVQVAAGRLRCLIIGSQGWLVTVDEFRKYLLEYNATNLIMHRNVSVSGDAPRSIAEHDGFYYIGSDNDPILVIDISNLSVVNQIPVPNNSGVRDMIFLNQGQTMVAASASRDALLLFERVQGSPGNYTLSYEQKVNCQHTHGLLYANNTFFYATSWTQRSIYSYSQINTSYWKEALFFDGSELNASGNGGHLTICLL